MWSYDELVSSLHVATIDGPKNLAFGSMWLWQYSQK